MRTKDDVQTEIITTIIGSDFRGIVLASVRSGKCRMLLTSIKYHSEGKKDIKVLVMYPNIDIKNSWIKECDIINYHPNITYCTFISIEKIMEGDWDYIVFDEAHLIPEDNILPKAVELSQNHDNVIFASGTYSKDTLDTLKQSTKMRLIVNYSTESAIKDGIVSEYNVFVHTYNLDNRGKYLFGKTKQWFATEVAECKRLTFKVNNSMGQQKMFHALARMRFINSCQSLINCVNKWIKDNPDERFLLFSGDEKIGAKYNLPMFNSKSKSDDNLVGFLEGKINQLCLIRKGSAGVTYLNLKTILVTAINSNGENLEQMIGRGLLDDTDQTDIHIFVSSEEFQQKWLKSALSNVPKNRINYV